MFTELVVIALNTIITLVSIHLTITNHTCGFLILAAVALYGNTLLYRLEKLERKLPK